MSPMSVATEYAKGGIPIDWTVPPTAGSMLLVIFVQEVEVESLVTKLVDTMTSSTVREVVVVDSIVLVTVPETVVVVVITTSVTTTGMVTITGIVAMVEVEIRVVQLVIIVVIAPSTAALSG